MAITDLKDTGSGESNEYLKDNPQEPLGNILFQSGQTINVGDPTIFSYSENEIGSSVYDKGYAATSLEDLKQNRIRSQSNLLKGVNAVIGGALSGLGTLTTDIGYLMDYRTLLATFSDIDFNANYNLFNAPGVALQELGKGMESLVEKGMPIYEKEVGEKDYTSQLMQWNTVKGVTNSIVAFGLLGGAAGTGVKMATKAALWSTVRGAKIANAAFKLNKYSRAFANTTKITNALNKGERIQAYARLLQKSNPELIQTLGAAAAGTLTKSAEARMEGLEAYEDAMRKAQPLLDSNAITQKEAENGANIAGNEAFGFTMMTAGLDAMMLKGLFRGKSAVKKKLLKPTRLKHYAGVAAGAPKESFEEAWQEAAKKEGSYKAFSYIKGLLDNDEDLKTLKTLGLDPKDFSNDFAIRMGMFLSSTDAMVAATIGAISGPFQQKFVNAISKSSPYGEKIKAFEEQQKKYKENADAFGKANKFKEKIKQVKLSDDLEKLSAITDDAVIEEIRQEAAFIPVAIENLMNGTTDQLREILKENQSPENVRYDALLTDMENKFLKARKHISPSMALTRQMEVEINKKLQAHYALKSQDTTLPEVEQKAFRKTASEMQDTIDKLDASLIEFTSKEYQVSEIEAEMAEEKYQKTKQKIATSTSITKLEKWQKQYPKLASLIKERIQILKSIPEQGKVKKGTTKESNAQEVGEIVEKGGPIYTVNGLEIASEKEVESLTDNILVGAFHMLNKENQTAISSNTSDNEEMISHYKKVLETAVSQEEIEEQLLKKANELYHKAISNKSTTSIIETEEVEEIETEEVETKSESVDPENNSTVNQKVAAKELLNVLGIHQLEEEARKKAAGAPSSPESAEEDDMFSPEDLAVPIEERKQQMLEEKRIAFQNFLATIPEGSQALEDFRVFLDTLIDALDGDIALVENFYPIIKGLFMIETKQDINQTFHEIMEMQQPDPVMDPEIPSKSNNTAINKIVTEVIYIATDSKSKEVMDLYADESTENLDKKNDTPATSFAHLSKAWIWKKLGLTKEGSAQVQREETTDVVTGNPLLNSEKFSAGSKVEIFVDEEYDGTIKVNGVDIPWKEFKTLTLDQAQTKYKLNKDELLSDFIPLGIRSAEDGQVAFVHDLHWINHLNVVPKIKQISREQLREFRKQFAANPKLVFSTVVSEKRFELSKKGNYVGFVLNQGTRWNNTQEALPDENLTVGMRGVQGITTPGRTSVERNVINENHLKDFGAGTSYVFVPLGKKNGVMQYHASPLTSNKITNTQAKAIRQTIEIFVTQNEQANPEMYQLYKDKGIDLKSAKDLNTVLQKVLYMYNSKKEGNKSLEEMLGDRVANKSESLGFLELLTEKLSGKTVQKVLFGRGGFKSMTKGDQTEVTKNLDYLEKFILPNMYFNANKKLFNSKDFYFIDLDTEGKLVPYEGDYNNFMKANTTTVMKSTELSDGGYAYTYQNIVTFDMETGQKPIEKKKTLVFTELKDSFDKLKKINTIESARKKELSDLDKTNRTFSKVDKAYSNEKATIKKVQNVDIVEQAKIDQELHDAVQDTDRFSKKDKQILEEDKKIKQDFIAIVQGKIILTEKINEVSIELEKDKAIHGHYLKQKEDINTGSHTWHNHWISVYTGWLNKLNIIKNINAKYNAELSALNVESKLDLQTEKENWLTNEEVISLAKFYKKSPEEFLKYVINGKITFEEYMHSKTIGAEARGYSKC